MSGRESAFSALITAEHASRRVPRRWQALFLDNPQVLQTHRAWDPGSRALARDLSSRLLAPLLEGQVTRLLVDLNRSAGHPQHLSEFTRSLPADERRELIECYWQPHWQAFREAITAQPGTVVHIACHSFTPVLNGVRRRADIGLLYDPSRVREKAWCQALAERINEQLPALAVRRNWPYRGTANGLGQQHRLVYDDQRLISVELEVNTRLVGGPHWTQIRAGLVRSVEALMLR